MTPHFSHNFSNFYWSLIFPPERSTPWAMISTIIMSTPSTPSVPSFHQANSTDPYHASVPGSVNCFYTVNWISQQKFTNSLTAPCSYHMQSTLRGSISLRTFLFIFSQQPIPWPCICQTFYSSSYPNTHSHQITETLPYEHQVWATSSYLPNSQKSLYSHTSAFSLKKGCHNHVAW